jgi:hypothetical protein
VGLWPGGSKPVWRDWQFPAASLREALQESLCLEEVDLEVAADRWLIQCPPELEGAAPLED